MVLYGINNIFTVAAGDRQYDCILKGKVLKGTGKSYAPLAPGDTVEIEIAETGFSRIESRLERDSEFTRWNRKKKAPQTLAANADLVACICSPDEPPFRPRFIDRVHVSAEIEELPLLIVLNKADLGSNRDTDRRLKVFKKLGCDVVRCSAVTGKGIRRLKAKLSGRKTVFCGQSGVGKTSILNLLIPEADRAVGAISEKYNRGTHTTRFGILLPYHSGGWIVDTPGIREFEITDIERADLSFYFPEMVPLLPECSVPGCTHDHEPDCAVEKALDAGRIHPDRFESYLRLLDSLSIREEMYGQS